MILLNEQQQTVIYYLLSNDCSKLELRGLGLMTNLQADRDIAGGLFISYVNFMKEE